MRESAAISVEFKGFDNEDRMWGMAMKRLQGLEGESNRLQLELIGVRELMMGKIKKLEQEVNGVREKNILEVNGKPIEKNTELVSKNDQMVKDCEQIKREMRN